MERSNVDQQHLSSNKTYRITFHADERGQFFAYVRINGRLPFMCGAGPLERVRREAEEWVAHALAVDAVSALTLADRQRRDETTYGRTIAASLERREIPAFVDAVPSSGVR